jgi:hypothetical protein
MFFHLTSRKLQSQLEIVNIWYILKSCLHTLAVCPSRCTHVVRVSRLRHEKAALMNYLRYFFVACETHKLVICSGNE